MATIDEIMADIRGKADHLVTVTVKQTLDELHTQSPVDTGRFRHSWRVGENQVDSSTEPEGENFPFPSPYTGRAKIGNIYYLTNSLDYAPDLAEGFSPQAPPGWIALISDQVPAIASDIARGLR